MCRDVNTSRAPVVDTTSIKAKPGQGCPRCGGKVFAAEQMLAKGSVSTLYFLIIFQSVTNYYFRRIWYYAYSGGLARRGGAKVQSQRTIIVYDNNYVDKLYV